MKNLLNATVAIALACALVGCKTVATGDQPGATTTTHLDAAAVALASEKAYTAGIAVTQSLVFIGQLPIAKVKGADLLTYTGIIAARAIADAIRPPSAELIAARQTADTAHASLQSL